MSLSDLCFHHPRQEILFVNLIRKILLKDFKDCDSIAEISAVCSEVESIHTRNCVGGTSPELPAGCVLSSILKTQLLVKNNFAKMEAFDRQDEKINCDKNWQMTLQDYKMGSTALDCSTMLTLRRINGSFDVR